jgi:hypothetical protein
MQMTQKLTRLAVLTITVFLFANGPAMAHCDSEDGPIIPSIRRALDDGSLTPALKWIAPNDEQEISSLFERVRALRTQSDEAKEIADQYFVETFIRIHRASEGAPYTGIKPAGRMLPVLAAADKALEAGSVDELTEKVADAVRESIVGRFNQALELSAHQNESVAAGRQFVEAYVSYVHFVEGLHNYLEVSGNDHHSTPEGGHDH